MKIKILDKNYIESHNLNEIEDETNELVHQLENDEIPYLYGEICEDCGKFSEDFRKVYTSTGGVRYICFDCLQDSCNYFYCSDCEEWYDFSVRSYTLRNGDTICEDCRNDHYIECERCGEIVHDDDAHYCEECDEYFCDYCWDDHYHEDDDNLLYDYHEFQDWRPTHTSTEPTPQFYIGHELEIDNGDLCEEVVSSIESKINGICMHDGSLSDSGIEIISHPLSYNYMLSKEQDYRDLFSQLTNDYGYKSHNTNTCGLHFHVTRPENPEIIDRIILFMETYKEEIIQLSRRNHGEISSWCNFLSDKRTNATSKEIKSLDYIKKNKETSTRYMALNLTNRKTIEFRIFKGTLKYETFMADFEFVYNLTTLASDLSLPIEELTWSRVTSMGKFLPNYINEHNLHTDKPIIDYTTELIVEKNRQKEQLRKELFTLYKELSKKLVELCTIDSRKKLNINNLIDLSLLSQYDSWLSSVIRDLQYINNNDDFNKTDIEYRINYIKERMI